MNALVVYDSAYGNTEQIARAIGAALGSQEEADVIRVGDVKPDQLRGLELLVVGSPTQRFRATTAMADFLKGIPKGGLKGIKIAAFDTRLTKREIDETPVLPFFVNIFGYAAKPISDSLKKKGGEMLLPPEGFYVEGMEGPLVAEELERAREWARQIAALGW
jgi:flavodoxin